MLEQLISSKTRLKVLKLFFSHPERSYYVREIAREVEEHLNSVRRELKNLKDLGLIKELDPRELKRELKINKKQKREKYFKLDKDFALYSELKALVVKSEFILGEALAKKIAKLGSIKLLILTGQFTEVEIETDILIVGRISRKKLAQVIEKFQKDFGRSIHYTILSPSEFRYRQDITDRFLYEIMGNRKIVVIDKLKIKN